MRVIGVTGGTGSGKSTVSGILERHGAKVLDADLIAREVTCKGEKALEEIAEHFGTGILDESGELDRRKLGRIVFNSPEQLEILNRITHKHVVERLLEGLSKAGEEKNIEMVVIDAPIPVKHGFMDLADEIWVIASEPDIRIKRIMQRSGLSCEEAQSRIRSQMKDEAYFEIADKIIYNNEDLEKLEEDVLKLLKSNECKENQG